jgi:hypothetical protein
LIQEYRKMTNDAIQIGLANNVSAMKRLSILSYKVLKRYDVPSCYRLCAISKAAGILASRKKSIKTDTSSTVEYGTITLVRCRESICKC